MRSGLILWMLHQLRGSTDIYDEWRMVISEIKKAVGEGVRELRIDFGPGYRVYYGIDEGKIILLLGGGTKRGQSQDIKKAISRWAAYKKLKKQR